MSEQVSIKDSAQSQPDSASVMFVQAFAVLECQQPLSLLSVDNVCQTRHYRNTLDRQCQHAHTHTHTNIHTVYILYIRV